MLLPVHILYASVSRDWWGAEAKFIKEKSLNELTDLATNIIENLENEKLNIDYLNGQADAKGISLLNKNFEVKDVDTKHIKALISALKDMEHS